MKTITFIILLFVFNNTSIAQNNFTVSGKIQRVAYYQGGMQLPDEYRRPSPLINYSIWIVKYNGEDTKPTLITKVTTDSLGHFNLKLPLGEYGFVLENDKNKLKKGQYLPTTPNEIITQIPDSGTSTSDNWTINGTGPFKVSKEGNNEMIITHYNVTVCYKCP